MSKAISKKKKSRSILPDYPFKSNFVQIDGLQLHYIDEGSFDDPVILFLHGVPTWSYTFRKIIPFCVNNGNRVVAPDLPGFGKSEKPAEIKIFFSGIIACNGLLPVLDQKAPSIFHFWKGFAGYSPFIPVGRIVDLSSYIKLNYAERKAYDFPFSNRKEKIAIRILPQLIPLKRGDPGADIIQESWNELENWEKPFLTVFSDNDPITSGGEKILQSRIPGTKNQPHRILHGKHFLQEDAPVELSKIINEFVKSIR